VLPFRLDPGLEPGNALRYTISAVIHYPQGFDESKQHLVAQGTPLKTRAAVG